MTMTISADKQRFVIRANIAKYEKLLATYLTPDERAYVERRLKEESSALGEFSGDDGAVVRVTQ